MSVTQALAASAIDGGPGFVLLARGTITIVGKLSAGSSAGASQLSGCAGGYGLIRSNCNYSSSAGGGGAFATNGGKGGDVTNNSEVGGAGGIANGNAQLVPLRGGCRGGGTNDSSGPYPGLEGGGGGAIQLVSRTRILVDGIIDVSGGGGGGDRYDQTNGIVLGGGGAGGAILLEAPAVELGANSQLLAHGGDGGSACGQSGVTCSAAGKGAHVGIAATAGADQNCNSSGSLPTATGGGGGGLGRVRINTASGSYSKASSSVEDAALTAGTIATR